jgi:hypothetical protein
MQQPAFAADQTPHQWSLETKRCGIHQAQAGHHGNSKQDGCPPDLRICSSSKPPERPSGIFTQLRPEASMQTAEHVVYVLQ